MSDSSEDQIHIASPARQQQARLDGDIPKSFELAAALQMMGAIVVAYLLFGGLSRWISTWTTENWSVAGNNISVNKVEVVSQLQTLALAGLIALAPMMLLLMLVGVASHWIQSGPMFVTKKVAPDLARMNPATWGRRLFSIEGLAFLILGLPKMAVAFGVLCFSSWNHREEFFQLANLSPGLLVNNLFTLVLKVVFQVAFALLMISVADFWLKYMSHQQRLKMTDQQLRDELRSQNADPQIRSRQRAFRQV